MRATLLKDCKGHKTHRFENGGTNQIRKPKKRDVVLGQPLPQTLYKPQTPKQVTSSMSRLVYQLRVAFGEVIYEDGTTKSVLKTFVPEMAQAKARIWP